MIRPAVLALIVVSLVTGVCACGSSSTPAAPTSNCTAVTLTPAVQTFTVAGGAGSLGVSIPTGCSWTAVASASWITVTDGLSGSGPGTVSFKAAPAPSTASRQGYVAVNTSRADIVQAGTPSDPSCRFSIFPAVRSVPSGPTTFTVYVSATTGCRWGIENSTTWLQIDDSDGDASDVVDVHVASNPGNNPRTGEARLAGEVLAILQDGLATPACAYSLSPPSRDVPAAGSRLPYVVIKAGQGCSWWADVESESGLWITFPSGSRGSGVSTMLPYEVAPNLSPVARTARVVIHGDSGGVPLVHTVQQAAPHFVGER